MRTTIAFALLVLTLGGCAENTRSPLGIFPQLPQGTEAGDSKTNGGFEEEPVDPNDNALDWNGELNSGGSSGVESNSLTSRIEKASACEVDSQCVAVSLYTGVCCTMANAAYSPELDRLLTTEIRKYNSTSRNKLVEDSCNVARCPSQIPPVASCRQNKCVVLGEATSKTQNQKSVDTGNEELVE